MEDKISALIEAQAAYETIQENIPILSQALPDTPEPVSAVAQIRGLAQDAKVDITGLSVPPVPLTNPPAKTTKLPTVAKTANFPLSISVTGKYTDVKTFLSAIANLRRVIQIEGLLFTPKKETPSVASGSATPASSSSLVQVDLKLKVFYLTP